MKARVTIFYKDSVFDPQGSTVAQSLRKVGFAKVKDVRIGKIVDVAVESVSKEETKREVEKMCEKLLVNPVIESFKVDVLDSSAEAGAK